MEQPFTKDEQSYALKVLRELGFKPYNLCWFNNHLCEFVSFPFFDKPGDRDAQVHLRAEIGEPTSMEKVPCSECHTFETLESKTHPMTPEALLKIAENHGYRDMTTQPGAFRF